MEGEPVKTVFVYNKTHSEKAVYSVYEKIHQRVEQLNDKKVTLIVPRGIFHGYGEESLEKKLRQFRKDLGLDKDTIEIVPYDIADMQLEKILNKVDREKRTPVLAITDWALKSAEYNEDFQNVLKNTRIAAIPGSITSDLDDKAWFHVQELLGTMLLQAHLTMDAITAAIEDKEENIATDMQKVVMQLRGGKYVALENLRYLLPSAYATMSVDDVFKGLEKYEGKITRTFAFLLQIINNVMLDMPVEPHDKDELQVLDATRDELYSSL